MNVSKLLQLAGCTLLTAVLAACGGSGKTSNPDHQEGLQGSPHGHMGDDFKMSGDVDGHEHGKQTAMTPPAPEVTPPPVAAPRETGVELGISDEIRERCKEYNLPTPKFAYDSTQVRPGDVPELRDLAACFTQGPLKDARIQLVGRADPRGAYSYNEGLGAKRADQVKRILTDQGVTEDRIATASRGEAEASDNPADWPQDRRVDIVLAD